MGRPRVPIEVRFNRSYEVNEETGCWEWRSTILRTGYPQIGAGGAGCKTLLAHRVAYELFVGPIPEGLTIDHLCRVRHCVNPAHLEAVTLRENVLRGDTPAAKNSMKTHCINGHPFNEVNTYMNGRSRACRACHRAAYARRQLEKRGLPA